MHCLAQALRPPQKTIQKLLRIQSRKYPIERVVRRNAVAQSQKRFKPSVFGVPKILHVIERFARAQQRAHGDHQNVDQLMIPGAINPRIFYRFKVRYQTQRELRAFHPLSFIQYPQKYHAKMAHSHDLFRCVCPGTAVGSGSV